MTLVFPSSDTIIEKLRVDSNLKVLFKKSTHEKEALFKQLGVKFDSEVIEPNSLKIGRKIDSAIHDARVSLRDSSSSFYLLNVNQLNYKLNNKLAEASIHQYCRQALTGLAENQNTDMRTG